MTVRGFITKGITRCISSKTNDTTTISALTQTKDSKINSKTTDLTKKYKNRCK